MASGLGDDAHVFSAEKPASFTPGSLRGHVPAFNAILSGSDQYLAQHSIKEEPAECSDSYSPFTEIGIRSNVQEEPVESLNYRKEPPICFGDIGDIKILMKVQ